MRGARRALESLQSGVSATMCGEVDACLDSTWRESREMVFAEPLLDDGLTDRAKLGNAVDRVELLHDFWLDILAIQRVEALARQLRVVAKVREELLVGRQRSHAAAYVADLPVQQLARATVTEHAAEQILLVQSSEHQRGRDRRGVEQQIHVF